MLDLKNKKRTIKINKICFLVSNEDSKIIAWYINKKLKMSNESTPKRTYSVEVVVAVFICLFISAHHIKSNSNSNSKKSGRE